MKKSVVMFFASLLFFACNDDKEVTLTLKINPSTLNMNIGEVKQLEVTLSDGVQPGLIVEWVSDNVTVATVDNNGSVTAVGKGGAIISARIGNATSQCSVSVSDTPVTAITLDNTSLMMITGDTKTIIATIEPDDATDPTIQWSSSDKAIATVGNNGEVTAVGAGDAVITATAGNISATCDVMVMDNPKIGDYYYEDGSWSDGGLQSIDADGLNPVWKSPKPAPKTGKTVVGIVFQTNPDRIADTEKQRGLTRGYVVAVKNAHSAESKTVMFSTDYEFASTPQAKIASTWYTNINGFNETMKVSSDYGPTLDKCPAFYFTLTDFPLNAPETSSGWFLPSTGQLWDMVANLCGHEVAEFLKQWQTSGRNVYHGYNSESVSYDVIAKFNETISMLPADQKEELFVTDDYYNTCTLWSTTSFDVGETANIIHIGGSTKPQIELMCEYIDYDGVARPILAF